MIHRPLLLFTVLLIAGCDGMGSNASGEAVDSSGNSGALIERAAINAGIVANPARLDPAGAYVTRSDRTCIVGSGGKYRIGLSIDYGDGHSCIARGEATGSERLKIDFGEGCRIEASYDGEKVALPAEVPDACERQCGGRATLAAFNATRLSGAEAEAKAMRGADGQLLCG